MGFVVPFDVNIGDENGDRYTQLEMKWTRIGFGVNIGIGLGLGRRI